MTDLFDHASKERIASEAPLAARMRPRTLDEFVGQEDIAGPGRLLRRAIEADRALYLDPLLGAARHRQDDPRRRSSPTGPNPTSRPSARSWRAWPTSAGSSRRRRERRKLYGQRTILLVDEIHRFNKAQQDALLPHVENGTIVLIGATTENPYFEVIGALVVAAASSNSGPSPMTACGTPPIAR